MSRYSFCLFDGVVGAQGAEAQFAELDAFLFGELGGVVDGDLLRLGLGGFLGGGLLSDDLFQPGSWALGGRRDGGLDFGLVLFLRLLLLLFLLGGRLDFLRWFWGGVDRRGLVAGLVDLLLWRHDT